RARGLELPARRERLREAGARLGVRGCEADGLLERGQRLARLVEREQQRQPQPPPGLGVLRRERYALAEALGEGIPVLERDEVAGELLAHRGTPRGCDAECQRLLAGRRPGKPGGAPRKARPLL